MEKKIYKSAQLLYPTTIFVEAPNILFYADAQVLAKLYNVIDQEPSPKYGPLFPKLKTGIHQMPYKDLQKMVQTKTSYNILYDIVDWGICSKRVGEGQTVFSYLDQLYKTLLYHLEEIPSHFEGTSIGYALRTLVQHENMKKLIMYLPVYCSSLHNELSQLFTTTNDKMDIVCGGELGTAIYAANADTYFLSHIQDVDHIMMIPEIKPREVYVPQFIFNQNVDASLGKDLEAQVQYYEPFKITINYIRLPF